MCASLKHSNRAQSTLFQMVLIVYSNLIQNTSVQVTKME